MFQCLSSRSPSAPDGKFEDPGFLVTSILKLLLQPTASISACMKLSFRHKFKCLKCLYLWLGILSDLTLIPFVGTHIALWGYQFYFLFSPNKFNLLVFILSPAIQYELFILHFPETVEAIAMFIAKNMQSIRLKQDALSLGHLLGYLLDYQFSPKATLDTLFTLGRFFFSWTYPWVHAIVFPRVLLHFCVTG